jgi:hypothetical protein
VNDASSDFGCEAPSAMTLVGLIKHMAGVEEGMMAQAVTGQPPAPPWDAIAPGTRSAALTLFESPRRLSDQGICPEGHGVSGPNSPLTHLNGQSEAWDLTLDARTFRRLSILLMDRSQRLVQGFGGRRIARLPPDVIAVAARVRGGCISRPRRS